MKNSSSKTSDDIEKYLKALAHPIRREVIRALAEKKQLSYSELMRITGVDDSGTFAFHIKMLQGLIEKDPVSGEYRLTEKGWRAYEVLKLLSGEKELRREEEKPTPIKERAKEVVVISDRVSFVLTRKLAEQLRKEGKKILLTDMIDLTIEEMPEELLDEVLEGITDVVTVHVPRELHHIVELKSKDVLFIGGKPLGFIGGIIRSVVEGVAKSLSSLPKIMMVHKGPRKHLKIIEPLGKKINKILIQADASRIEVSNDGDEGQILVVGDFFEGSEPVIKVSDDKCSIEVVSGSAKIKVPPSINEYSVSIDASAFNARLNNIRQLTIDSDASGIHLNLEDLGESSIHINSDSSAITAVIKYREYSGRSSVVVDGDSSSVSLRISIPQDIALNTAIEEGHGIIEYMDLSTRSYKDPWYDEAKSKLDVIIRNSDGASKVRINKKYT